MKNRSPAPTQSAEEIDPEAAKSEFERQVGLSAGVLEGLSNADFRRWMETMIKGIVCFAGDCNNKILQKEDSEDSGTFHSSHRRAPRQTAKGRATRIEEWREAWQDGEFQEWINQLKPESKVTRRDNFRYLADHFKRGEWIHLVSNCCRHGGRIRVSRYS